METKQAFQVVLQMREKFVGTKQEQIIIDQSLQCLSLELFPQSKPEKMREAKKSK